MTLREIERLAAQHARERETTLDRAQKRAHGVVHTPPELAQRVVRESDRLLRERLQLSAGIAAEQLLWLDPACGPGAFFAAGLALGEQRTGFALHGLGFDLDAQALALAARLSTHPCSARLQLVHADALATDEVRSALAPHAGPLLVLGNPPWVTARAQLTALDRARLEPFRRSADGVRLPERKLGVLTDAYVRFFALCAELVRDRDAGAVVALVSNGSYLDGLMHRGMRARLLSWFDELYVLDLGGSALLGRSRELRDDNVFGVRPSVAVTWLCRLPGPRAVRPAGKAFYARMLGSQAHKAQQLMAAEPLAFEPLAPEPPQLFFVPRARRDPRYASYPALSEWLPFQREGVQSNRDAVVVDHEPARLLERLRAFSRGDSAGVLAVASKALHHYDPARARRAVAAALEADPEGTLGIVLQPLAYRPFDTRVFCPVIPLCHRPRPELARALAHAPAGLVSVRKDRGDLPWQHSAWATSLVDNCFLSARSSCRARAFPLCDPDGAPNLDPELAQRLAEATGEHADVATFQHYALTILSAARYRARWDGELRQDYPRIPVPQLSAAYRQQAQHGALLAELYTRPLCVQPSQAVLPARTSVSELELSEAEGCIRLAGRTLLTLTPQACSLRVGHHRPLAAWLASHAKHTLDRATLARLLALAQRLDALADALRVADELVSSGQF